MSTSQTRTLRADEARHLLRRLTFTATPDAEKALTGRPVAEAVDSIISAARRAAQPAAPDFVQSVWVNRTLRYPGTTSQEYQAMFEAQSAAHQRDLERLRQWWLREMIGGAAPLRENLILFVQGTLGSSTGSADMPQAVYGANALQRTRVLGTIPDLLEALVVEPAMLMQLGIDEFRRDKEGKFFDRGARLLLDNWTVGAGEYAVADVDNLTRALTGWLLVAPPGYEPKKPLDPEAFRSARRTGLVPTFDREHFEDGSKTILGKTDNFDARSAVRHLAMLPATARRYSRRLIDHFGVDDSGHQLEARLVDTYRATGGSMEAMVREIAVSDQFWSETSRWQLIKSPVHLAVGAARQLGRSDLPLAEINQWLAATGQKLFDTPGFGDSGWAGQQAWVTPPDRLAVRYQLGRVLRGQMPPLGLLTGATPSSMTPSASPGRPETGAGHESARAWLTQLDPAPGVDTTAIDRRASSVKPADRSDAIVREILATPQYQLA